MNPPNLPHEPFATPFDLAVWIEQNAGIRVEMVSGLTVWEAFPTARHQRTVDRIRESIVPLQDSSIKDESCSCVHLADVYVRFPDGSYKRPDISVFCREPAEQDTAITMLPEAVIEIISPNYADKDLAVGVPFYLRMQIKDILVLDPETNLVRHFRPGQSEVQYTSPHTLTLECGCEVTV